MISVPVFQYLTGSLSIRLALYINRYFSVRSNELNSIPRLNRRKNIPKQKSSDLKTICHLIPSITTVLL